MPGDGLAAVDGCGAAGAPTPPLVVGEVDRPGMLSVGSLAAGAFADAAAFVVLPEALEVRQNPGAGNGMGSATGRAPHSGLEAEVSDPGTFCRRSRSSVM